MDPEEEARLAQEAEAAKAAEAEAAAAKAAEEAAAAAAAEAEAAKDDKSKVDDEKAKLLKEVMKYKDDAKKAKAEAEKFKGIDLEKAKAALAAQAEAERKELEAKGEYQRIIAQVAEEADKKVKEAEAAVAEANAKLEALQRGLEEKELSNSFANSTFVREKLVISGAKVRVLYGDHFDTVDGEIVGYDKPRGAKDRTPLVDDKGNNLPFEAALEKVIKADSEWERLAKADIKRGSGSATSTLKAKDSQAPETPKDRIKAGLAGIVRPSLNLKR